MSVWTQLYKKSHFPRRSVYSEIRKYLVWSTSRCQVWPIKTGHTWVWPIKTGHTWVWPIKTGYTWVWPIKTGHTQPEHNKVTSNLGIHGMSRTMTRFDETVSTLTRVQKPSPLPKKLSKFQTLSESRLRDSEFKISPNPCCDGPHHVTW